MALLPDMDYTFGALGQCSITIEGETVLLDGVTSITIHSPLTILQLLMNPYHRHPTLSSLKSKVAYQWN